MTNFNPTLFIDLDGTVYDKHNGMWDEMSARIDIFLHQNIGIPADQVIATRDRYYAAYGSTLRGIQLNHEIDPEEYLTFVHELDLNKYLKPDPALRNSLAYIPYPKWIFTNSDRNHAYRVLQAVGIEDLFDGILDVWSMFYIPKPERWTFLNAMMLTGYPVPADCVLVDDTAMNLKPARELGWKTVWVDGGAHHPQANYTINRLHELPKVIRRIRENEERQSLVSPLDLQLAEI
jgi:putative hydrolase of the HAD superfamily